MEYAIHISSGSMISCAQTGRLLISLYTPLRTASVVNWLVPDNVKRSVLTFRYNSYGFRAKERGFVRKFF